MKLCNETITVFNAHWDEDAGDDVYNPTVVTGVSWFDTQAETVDPKGGLIMANKAVIRIPIEAVAAGVYVEPNAYRQSADVRGMWTLTGGTIIVKGALPPTIHVPWTTLDGQRVETGDGNTLFVNAVISGYENKTSWTPAQLKEAFADCVTVLGVTDNRRAPNGKHFKVVGS